MLLALYIRDFLLVCIAQVYTVGNLIQNQVLGYSAIATSDQLHRKARHTELAESCCFSFDVGICCVEFCLYGPKCLWEFFLESY